MMEERTFRHPDVLRILQEKFIEARLHTDGTVNIDRIRELQAELAGSVATPYYLVIDPATGDILGVQEGATLRDEDFEGFLLEAVEQGPW